ncbi:MAG TPA: DegV family protein [Firmicutes bacterium]|nr:DegV family protein [Candidatus Fermentithermobacillaceae bacterium]
MKTVQIVTDSTASLDPEVIRRHDISVVPLWVQVGEESYKDGVTLSTEEFYKKLDGPVLPSTSSPPPGDFVEVYRRLAKKAKDILSIHLSRDASATCQAAEVAATSVSNEADVTVYDSRSFSMGIGFLAMEAARSAVQGLSKDQIIAKLDSLRDRVYTYVAIPTLKYLRKSGRVTQGQAILASILSIKPVLEIRDGIVKVVDHVRTYSGALARLLDLAQEKAGNVPTVVAVMHANAREEAEKFAVLVKKRLNVKELFIGEMGPVLAVHGGPGMIGIVFYNDKH